MTKSRHVQRVHHWTPAEDAALAKHLAEHPGRPRAFWDEVAVLFPGRKGRGLRHRAARLKLWSPARRSPRTPPWTEAEENRLRTYAKTGPEAFDALSFWAQAVPLFKPRTASALRNKASKLNVWTFNKTRHGAIERTCSCGSQFAKRDRRHPGDDPALLLLCTPCVRRIAAKKRRHSFTCTHCQKPSTGTRRQRVCALCKDRDGDKRVRAKSTRQLPLF